MGRGWGRERERGCSLAQTTNTNSSDREREREGENLQYSFRYISPLYLSSLAATIHFNYLQFNTEIS